MAGATSSRDASGTDKALQINSGQAFQFRFLRSQWCNDIVLLVVLVTELPETFVGRQSVTFSFVWWLIGSVAGPVSHRFHMRGTPHPGSGSPLVHWCLMRWG